MIGWKLFRQRKDGTLGPLFINQRLVLRIGEVYHAEDHPTKGYAHRPGWHLAESPHAPHLTTRGRVWARVEYGDHYRFERPSNQGGYWIIAKWIRILSVHPTVEVLS